MANAESSEMRSAESFEMRNAECGMANAESTKCGMNRMRNAECGMRNYLQEVRTYEGTSQLRNAEFGVRNGLKSKVQGARDGTAKVAKRAEWE